MKYEYLVANPTGNITVLVTSEIAPEERSQVVKEIFETEPSCEQVGFVNVTGERSISLEMMGGEFCGNATLSAAAYCAKANNLLCFEGDCAGSGVEEISVDASGIDEPVTVVLSLVEDDLYEGTLEMPIPEIDGTVVHLDGISHMIVPSELVSRQGAEASIRGYAKQFDALAFGMLRYSENSELQALASENYSENSINKASINIEPLVYVKGSNTMVWEHGCASGSIAAAYYKHCKSGANRVSVFQPGGIITIDIGEDKLYLTGSIQL